MPKTRRRRESKAIKRRGQQGKATGHAIEQDEAIYEAVRLRRQNFTIEQIAKRQGCSYAVARERLNKAREMLFEATVEDAAEIRQLQTERYDLMMQRLWVEVFPPPDPATGQTPPIDVPKLEVMRKIMSDYSRLHGAELSTTTNINIEVMASFTAKMAVFLDEQYRDDPETLARMLDRMEKILESSVDEVPKMPAPRAPRGPGMGFLPRPDRSKGDGG